MSPDLHDWLRLFAESLPEHLAPTFQPLREAMAAEVCALEIECGILRRQLQAVEKSVAGLNEEKAHLLEQVRRLRLEIYGASSEKLHTPPSAEQPQESASTAADPPHSSQEGLAPAQDSKVVKLSRRSQDAGARPRTSNGRAAVTFPPELTAEVLRFDIDGPCKCCGGQLRWVSDDSISRLKARSPFYVSREVYSKYQCRSCRKFVQRQTPKSLFQGSALDRSFLAEAVVSRFVDCLPTYRLEQRLKHIGVKVDRATIVHNFVKLAGLLEPICDVMHEFIKTGRTADLDETTLPLLDPGRGETLRGYLWAIMRDDRRHQPGSHTAALFVFQTSRSSEHARALVGDFRGKIMMDGYSGYDCLEAHRTEGRIERVSCNAHARRYFVKANQIAPTPLSKFAVEQWSKMYAIEPDLVGLDPEERCRRRQAETEPIFRELVDRLVEAHGTVPAKSVLGQAINYTLPRLASLRAFIDDGELEIDYNMLENLMRKIALGRKNSLFAASRAGAWAWGIYASLVATCELNGIDPRAYFVRPEQPD